MINYRTHDVGDIRRLIEFHYGIYRDKFSFNEEYEQYGIIQLQKIMEGFIPDKDRIFIAEEHGTLIGSAIIKHISSDRAKLSWLNVKPEYIDQPVRRTIVKKAIEFCKKNGYSVIVLTIFSILDDASQIYLEEGFKLVREHKTYLWGQHLSEDTYELVLT